MTQEQFGTTTPVYNKLFYNSRGQLAEILAATSGNDTTFNRGKIINHYSLQCGGASCNATVTSGWGSAPVLHDNPLVVAETTVQARHITELRDAINALRSHLNMSAYLWQYSATTSDYISGNPVLEMRTALDQAIGAPSGGYSAGLAQGQLIKAIHIQELRDRVLAAWTSSGSTDIRWLVADQLGTPRMIFDQTGSLANVSRHDYLPFGEELFAGTGGRTTAQGFTLSDNVRQKFTQKERDNETGLDYFGARYYGSTQGRFTGADNIVYSKAVDPQTWNQYAYCRNGPLNHIDPDGHNWYLVHHANGNDSWEWHKGKKTKAGEVWKDKATGTTYTSKWTNLVYIDISSGTNSDGSHTATVTLFGKGFHDVLAQDRFAFSGAPGSNFGDKSGPPSPGEYFINLNKVGGIETNYTLHTSNPRTNNTLASFRNGFQYIEPAFQGSWGHVRANLARAAWSAGQPFFDSKGSGTDVYLHGHVNSFPDSPYLQGRSPYNYTIGCVGAPDEQVLNSLSTLKSHGGYPVVPTTVHRDGH